MPNIASAFRQETTRLARREIKSQTQALKESSVKFRSDIAALKRQVSELKTEVARLVRRSGKAAPQQAAETDGRKVRFSAKSVMSQRTRLGISAADFGKLIGVTGHTIYSWEKGTSRPRQAQLAALSSIRSLGKKEAVTRLEQGQEKKPLKRAAKA